MPVELNDKERTALDEVARVWGVSREEAAIRLVAEFFARLSAEAQAAIGKASA